MTKQRGLVLQVVDAERHPEGYILEGSTPVAQEQKEKQKEAGEDQPESKDGAAAEGRGTAGSGGTNKPCVSVAKGGVIELMSDDDEELPAKVGGKRKLSDGAGPSTSKAQKVDDEIIVVD